MSDDREAKLEAAYRAAVYVILDANDAIETAIDQPNPAVAALLARHGEDRAALITACNPEGENLPPRINTQRQRDLEDELAAAGVVCIPALGRSRDSRWQEPSVLALGIDRAAALACAARWGQRAIVLYDTDGCGRLCFRGRKRGTATQARTEVALPDATLTPPTADVARTVTGRAGKPKAGKHDFSLPHTFEFVSASSESPPESDAGAVTSDQTSAESELRSGPAEGDAGDATVAAETSVPAAPVHTRVADYPNLKILVTGGGGFLGLALCRQLVARGAEVISFSRSTHAALEAIGVRQIQGDIASFEALEPALEGIDAVFHVAAKAGAWGSFREYFDANVVGTRNVITACRFHGVRTLVFTSTPSVAHEGRVAVRGGDEQSAPPARQFKAAYPATKAIAEQAVLEANDTELATVALRPRLIWGPGDNHLLPRLAARARAGRLRLVGEGRNNVDTTYIDNAVDAHLAAFDALHGNPAAVCAGRAYFVSNGEPRPIGDIVNGLLRAVGAPPVHRRVSFGSAYLIGATAERVWSVFGLSGEPPMTRFIAEQLATTHWYDISAAYRDFGWRPQVGIDEGLARLAAAAAEQSDAT